MANFLVPELIRKKRDGGRLGDDEIRYLVKGLSDGSIPDYQAAAWLMASYLRGMERAETACLTRAVRDSGQCFDWRKLSRNFRHERFADKHSTGGVGDKVSLILAPVAVCLGLKVPMMSGRGLGHTGGTVDKLESIPGFSMHPTEKQMIEFLDRTGTFMMAQREDICPADKRLYHLRDVTATIESVPLITASIVSKKWAEGVDAIVFDIKCGSGAFMETPQQAETLAKSLVATAEDAGMKALACLTRMDEPLGSMIGNSLEVIESLRILSDEYPSEECQRLSKPLLDISLRLAAEMAVLGGTRPDLETALEHARESITDGSALRVFVEMTQNQGAVEDWHEKLPTTRASYPIVSPRQGVLTAIKSRELGLFGIRMGAGRERLDSKIDPAVGIEMCVGPGDEVVEGEPLLFLHLHDDARGRNLREVFEKSVLDIFEFDGEPAGDPTDLLIKRIPE